MKNKFVLYEISMFLQNFNGATTPLNSLNMHKNCTPRMKVALTATKKLSHRSTCILSGQNQQNILIKFGCQN